MPALTRRDVFRLLGSAALLSQLPACGDNRSGDHVFTSSELQMLEDFADVILPPDDQPGGRALGAVAYIEGLVTAFDATIPRIYAGGPFSNRSGSTDDQFGNFVELDRVNLAAWQKIVLGTGTAPSLKDQLKQGLAAARAMHVSDPTAAFAAPEYGGNPGTLGWQMIHFEGDSLPLGYSQWNGQGYDERAASPMSTANPSDPEPLTDDIRQLLDTVAAVLGGKSQP